jgi:WD repeat-containing protein 70
MLKQSQIVTGLANGQICVLYSPLTSINGAKLPLNKGPPRKATIEDMSDALAAPTIITPHALPMFRDGEIARGTKRKREKDRMDPRKSKRPELPVTGPGKGGRVGASATQHVVQNLVRDTTRDEDVSGTSFVLFVSANLRLRSITLYRIPSVRIEHERCGGFGT